MDKEEAAILLSMIFHYALLRESVIDSCAGEFIMFCVRADQEEQAQALPPGMVAVDADLMELKRGNLLLEREKLGLEIQILRAKMAKLNQGDAV